MPGFVLTAASVIKCTHGGAATVVPTQTSALADSSPILTEKDLHSVAGCPLNVAGSPQPCVTISWQAGSQKVKAAGNSVLTRSSVGECKGSSGAVQGVAVIVSTQTKVRAS